MIHTSIRLTHEARDATREDNPDRLDCKLVVSRQKYLIPRGRSNICIAGDNRIDWRSIRCPWNYRHLQLVLSIETLFFGDIVTDELSLRKPLQLDTDLRLAFEFVTRKLYRVPEEPSDDRCDHKGERECDPFSHMCVIQSPQQIELRDPRRCERGVVLA